MQLLATSQKQFFWTLLASLGIHLFLIFNLPGLPMGDFALPAKSYTEVKLIYVPPKPIKTVKKAGERPAPRPSPSAEQYNLLTEQINKLSRLKQPQSATPQVQLPAEVPEQEITGLLPKVSFSMEEIILPAGPPPTATSPLPEIIPPQPTGKQTAKPNDLASQIEWVGTPRRPVYQPALPQYSSPIEGEVHLKFGVDPTGKVTTVIVLQKLDADLERISLQYMKQWVFEPLRPGTKQETQWGVIPIQFRLE